MFSWIKKVLNRRAAERLQVQVRQARLARALLHQVRQAVGVRQLALLDHLLQCWLPVHLRRVVRLELQARLLALPTQTPGCRKSTACSDRTARHSTSKRRRAR